eukprot:GHVU01122521.1.p3 GENE.GHVU01122521.1~~GHVU01122521.1.p3  ORF type:complete len:131 (+),score=23.02 GHVU01122521.1:1577-1969(+)
MATDKLTEELLSILLFGDNNNGQRWGFRNDTVFAVNEWMATQFKNASLGDGATIEEILKYIDPIRESFDELDAELQQACLDFCELDSEGSSPVHRQGLTEKENAAPEQAGRGEAPGRHAADAGPTDLPAQ